MLYTHSKLTDMSRKLAEPNFFIVITLSSSPSYQHPLQCIITLSSSPSYQHPLQCIMCSSALYRLSRNSIHNKIKTWLRWFKNYRIWVHTWLSFNHDFNLILNSPYEAMSLIDVGKLFQVWAALTEKAGSSSHLYYTIPSCYRLRMSNNSSFLFYKSS